MPAEGGDYAIRRSFRSPARAADYDRTHTRTLGQRLRLRTELAVLARAVAAAAAGPARLLDVPCGTGRHAAHLQALGHRVTGLDVSSAMAAVAAARPALAGTAFRAAVGEVERLPFADATFDVAVSVRLLRHLPEPVRWRAAAELARVARRGAVFDLLLRHGPVAWLKRAREGQAYAARRPSLAEARAALAGRGLTVRAVWSPRPWTQQRFLHVERP